MKNLLKLLVALGVFLIIGTAGAGDIESISFAQTMGHLLISFSIIVGSYFGLKLISIRENKKARRNDRVELRHVA